MIQPPDIRYTLNVRGIDETVLVNAPIEWQKMTINLGRSTTQFGIIRTLTDPLEFVTKGAQILRSEFFRYSIKANVRLRIEVLQNDWSYKIVYYGSLDFSNITNGDTSFTINGKDDDIASKIKAYGDASFEIPINVPEAVTLTLNPIRLIETSTSIINPAGVRTSDFFPAITIVTNVQNGTIGSSQNVTFLKQTDPPFGASDKWFYKATTAGTVNFTGYINFEVINDGVIYVNSGPPGNVLVPVRVTNVMDISLYNQNGTKLKTYFNSSAKFTGTQIIDLKAAINVNAGDKLFLYFDSSNDGKNNEGFLIDAGEIDISYFTESPATPCKCLPGKYLFDQILQNINDGLKVDTSSFLLGITWKQLLFTSGDAIRQLVNKQVTNADGTISTVPASPVIKTSLNELFKSVNAVTNCGLGNERGKIVIESKSYFFRQQSKAVTFNGIKNFKLTVDQSLLYNTIKAGYPDQTYDQTNGRDEVNSEVNWITPCAATDGQAKELDLQSVYRADPYGIEFTRINFSGKGSIDAASDNDTFMIYANPALTMPFTAADGLKFFSGTAAGNTLYNWFISPKRNLLRHGNYLRSCFFRLENYKIKFGTAAKNKDLMTTDINGFAVKESADILISTLDKPLFTPYKVSLTAAMARETLGFVDTAMYGYIDFKYKAGTVKTFISDFSFDISKDSAQEFTGIVTADTDFDKLL